MEQAFSYDIPGNEHTDINNSVIMTNYKIYKCRIESFRLWPYSDKIEPSRIAKSGLYYSNFDDICICPWCLVRISKWCYFDDPITEHKKYSRNCDFLKMISD